MALAADSDERKLYRNIKVEDMKSEFRLEFSNQENRNAFSDVPFVSGIFHWNVQNKPKMI